MAERYCLKCEAVMDERRCDECDEWRPEEEVSTICLRCRCEYSRKALYAAKRDELVLEAEEALARSLNAQRTQQVVLDDLRRRLRIAEDKAGL